MAAKIRRDDEVIVISGKDRGKTGKVLRVDPAKQRVYVEGLNIIKRHQRPQQVRGAQRAETVGGVIEKEGPIHVSNVMLSTPRTRSPTRVGRSCERRQAPARARPAPERRSDGRHRSTTRASEDPLPRGDPPGAHRALRLHVGRCRRRRSRRSR